MVILTLLDPQTQAPLRQWRFEHEPLIQIGRAPDNHVIVPDRFVSRHHLELRWLERSHSPKSSIVSGWQLINHSSNGTFLNGILVSRSKLPATGLLQLAQGGPSLQFQVVVAPEALWVRPRLPAIAAPVQSQPPMPSASSCAHSGNPPENLFCIHCGSPLNVQKTVRQYQVLRVLGKGGMGTTYLAWNQLGNATPTSRAYGKLVVIKEMNADVAQIPKAQELFEREATTLSALNHPGIPRFYDFFLEYGKKYLVMELIHGQDLEKRLRQQGPVSPAQAIQWMIETCDVLDYLHTRPLPIIHRDIKPSNLLVQSVNQRIVVLDFGAVKTENLRTGTRIGAEGYSAPEQTQGRPVIQSDLYAIGACLIYLLTGESPQHYYRRCNTGYRLMPKECAALTSPLRQVVERVTAPRPSDRYATAQALAQALANCL